MTRILHYDHSIASPSSHISIVRSANLVQQELRKLAGQNNIQYAGYGDAGYEFLGARGLDEIVDELNRNLPNFNFFLVHPGVASNFRYVFSLPEEIPSLRVGILAPNMDGYQQEAGQDANITLFPGYKGQESSVAKLILEWIIEESKK